MFFGLLRARPLDESPFEQPAADPNVLIIRQQNQMGDMLLATPCLRALRESLPKSRITLVASHENEAVVRNNPHVDEVLVYDKRRFRSNPLALPRFLRALRKRSFDICVVLSTVSSSVTSALLCLISGARYRVGYSGEGLGVGFVDRAFHDAVPMPEENIHQSRLGLRLLEHFGIRTKDLSPIMRPSEEDSAFADEFLSRASLKTGSTLLAIHPGAGKKKNRWPASGFARVANEFQSAHRAQVIVMGGPSDQEVLDAMMKELKFKPVVLTGQSIGRIAAVMKELTLFICNDTGVLHVAAAVGCPTLALFGPTDPRWWAPLAEGVRTLRAPDSNMERLSEEAVLDSAVELLSRAGDTDAD
jgi:lipopolysaccharide heptosyltransferase II